MTSDCPAQRPTSDRTWPVPSQAWVLKMTWSELLFAHWEVPAEQVAPFIPPGLQLDTRDGMAWVGVVPFLMTDVTPRLCPPIPRLSRFLELNVRTYVTCEDKPGVWFFSLDAESKIAVRGARSLFHLPYMDATMSLLRSDANTIRYRSERTHRGEPPASLDASYASTGPSFHARPGTLEHWLTARYCLYSADQKGRVYRGEIDHPPWMLTHAHWTVDQNTMGEPYGFRFVETPHLLFAEPVKVRAWSLSRCG